MKLTLVSVVFASLAAFALAQGPETYRFQFYKNYDCTGTASLLCTADPTTGGVCCNAPNGSNSVRITYSGKSKISELNWAISANKGCNSPVRFDTKFTLPGPPGGQGCYNAHDASVGSVIALRPAP